jgi:alginate O-acetyltransferase complex protein AlgI
VAYLFDIYNEITDSESDFLGFALYLAFFPKIIAGPITRYRDIVEQLHHPQLDRVSVANGIRRFIIGIAKKVLIADVVGQIVTPAFGLSAPTFSTGIAWLALAAFAIQLYFDFSGYTDMAIGLGQMLGFRLPENFNAPYLSRSITEFWRRWHISLSSWFRDYVFTPLEFKRRKVKTLRQQSNILFVFLLTGLWHGFTLNFIVWGLLHGAAIALESTAFGKWLRRSWAPLQHVYAMGIVLISWVFFRSPDLLYALRFTKRLLGFGLDIAAVPYSLTKPLPVIENSVWLALVMGLVFILPVGTWLKRAWQYLITRYQLPEGVFLVVADVILLVLLVAAVATTAGLTQQSPNIYAVF